MKKLITKLTTLLIAITLSTSLMAQTATAPTTGDGSVGNPYQIATINNLYWLSQQEGNSDDTGLYWSRNYIQTDNIDASTTSGWVGDAGFSPIGNATTKFTGNYNGQNHTISNLFIYRPSSIFVGLFGWVEGVISNLGLTSATITGNDYTGAIVGFLRESTSNISNCYSTGSVTGGQCTGGLVGYLYAFASVENCYTTCTVEGSDMVGGFVGRIREDCSIDNSYSTGNTTGGSEYYEYIGGFTGLNAGLISNCYSHGNAICSVGSGRVGGFCGTHKDGIIQKCYSTGRVIYNNATNPTNKGFCGALELPCSYPDNFFDKTVSLQDTDASGTATPKTTAEMKQQSTFTNWDFDVDGVSAGNNGDWIMAGYPHLQMEWSATVSNLVELQMVVLDVDESYTQSENIDASATSTWNYNGSTYDGFLPIGNSTTKFAGNYDGQDNTISNLIINRSGTSYIGLFGYTDGGTIQNLGVTSVNISGNQYVGALVGLFSGTITNCYTSGSVTSSSHYAGGFVGFIFVNGNISNSYTTTNVYGGTQQGGFTSNASAGVTIENCYSLGDVTLTSGSRTDVGSFLGYDNSGAGTDIIINNCYATGDVTFSAGGTPTDRGFVGEEHGGTFTNNFFDSEASNQTTATGATGKDTDAMKNVATFTLETTVGLTTAWDFTGNPYDDSGSDNYWSIDGSNNSGYPWLTWEGYAPVSITWDGSESTDWNSAANWSLDAVPTVSNNPVINSGGNQPVISAIEQATCNNLTVNSGATLTIQSTSSGTGSLIINGTLSNSGTITTYSYFPGSTLWNWHMISAPVISMDISESNFIVDPAANYDFYAWDEPTPGTWSNYKNESVVPIFNTINGGDNFVPGKGYLVAYNEANPTKTYTGTLNTGNQTFTLKNSGSKSWTYVTGWNLIGNPYSSSIDWNLATRTQFQDNYAYAYNPNKDGGAGYEEINGANTNAYIAPHQGFFVLATTDANDESFTFTNSIQTHGDGSNIYKNTNNDDALILRLAYNNYYDETSIMLDEQSTFNRDCRDALKMFSFDNAVPQLYCFSDNEIPLAVNSMPEITTQKSIPLGMHLPEQGIFTISISQPSISIGLAGIYLEDHVQNTIHKLSESDYSFVAESGDINDRFTIHFGIVGIDESISQVSKIQTYASNNTLYILNPNQKRGTVTIYNLTGQKVTTFKLTGETRQQQQLNIADMINIVKIQTNDEVISEKVIFK